MILQPALVGISEDVCLSLFGTKGLSGSRVGCIMYCLGTVGGVTNTCPLEVGIFWYETFFRPDYEAILIVFSNF